MPIFVKMGASRVFDDVKLAAKAGADVIVVDGMEGGTGASPAIFQEHTGIPTLAAVCEARAALEDCGLYGEVQLIIAGGIRDGVDAAKAIALGADAVYIGTAALIALNCNKALYVEDYHALGTEPGYCHHCHTGRCPVGITTQDPELMERLRYRPGRGARCQSAARHDARDSDAGAGLRQVGRASPGAGRHGGAYHGSFGDLRNSAGRDPQGIRKIKRMSFLLRCPHCGERSVYEFRFGGESRKRPAPRGRRTRTLSSYTLHQAATWPACRGNGGIIAAAVANGSRPSRNTRTNEVLRNFVPAG